MFSTWVRIVLGLGTSARAAAFENRTSVAPPRSRSPRRQCRPHDPAARGLPSWLPSQRLIRSTGVMNGMALGRASIAAAVCT